jgi:transcriptional regulator with XRE-family HTH domain
MTINLKAHLRARGQNFSDIRVLARINKNDVARILGVHEATVRRWNRNSSHPEWAYKLIGLHAGWLLQDGWQGWFFDEGLLYHPEYKYGFSPQDVTQLAWLRSNPVAGVKLPAM